MIAISVHLPAASASSYQLDRLKEKVEYADGEIFQTEADFYRPSETKAKAILYLFPTINGPSPLEKTTARYFVRRGFAVIIPAPLGLELNIEKPDTNQLDRDYFKPSAAAEQMIKAADKILNSSYELPVFALGASQGGIRTVGLTAESSRIKGAWFAVAGGNFPLVYATSQVEKIQTMRNNHMKALGLTEAKDYENYLRENLKNDPLYSCQKINVPVVQVIALQDDKVPTSTQLEMNSQCPIQKTITIKGGHVSGVSTIYFYRQAIREFFTKILGETQIPVSSSQN